MRKLNKKGFTLIELLVVISILSVVLSISMYFIVGILSKAREKTYNTTINEIEKAASNYLKENSDELVFVKGNDNVEYQCVVVKDLIDYGFLNNDVTKSQIDDDGTTVDINNNIYIERNTTTKAIQKNVYIKNIEDDANKICNYAIQAKGTIDFSLSPNEWSKKKNVQITYSLKYVQDRTNYRYEYVYSDILGNELNSESNSDSNKSIVAQIAGNIYADINNIITEDVIVSKNQVINKIDNDGPVITLKDNNDSKQSVGKSVTIPLSIKDCDDGNCSGLKEYNTSELTSLLSNGKIIVKVGDNQISYSNLTLTKVNLETYNLKINNTEYNGDISIEILENSFIDKVADEEKNGNEHTVLTPNIEFDNINPGALYTSTNDAFVNSQTLTIKCSDNYAVKGYYFGKTAPSDNTTYELIDNVESFQTQKTVDSSGTYYLSCKDAANNVETVQVKYFNYTFRYMFSNENGVEGKYNFSNYSQVGSDKTYLLLDGGTISTASVEQEVTSNTPKGSNYNNRYRGYSKINSSQSVSDSDIFTLTKTYKANDFKVSDNTIYIFWFNRNILYVKYKINTDELLVIGSAGTDTYSWANDNGYLERTSVSNNNSTILFHNYKYKTGNTAVNFYNNNASSYFAITKNDNGYLPVDGSEWKCINGCIVDGKTFSQLQTPMNVNNEICNIENDDCTIELQVNWSSISYNISYNLNNGTYGSSHPTEASYDEVVTISNPSKTVTITGNDNGTGATIGSNTSKAQTFKGWSSTSIDSSAKTGSSASSMVSWNGTSTTNTYFKNLKQANDSIVMSAEWTPVAMQLPTVSKTGYVCKWYSISGTSGGSLVGESGATYTPSAGTDANITVYARCEANTYTLTYNCTENGGTSANITQQYSQNSSVNLQNSCVKSGWKHIGWNTDKDAHIGLSSYSMPNGASQLYAIYEKDVVITFDTNGSGTTLTNTLTGETSTTTMNISCTAYNKTGCRITTPSISGDPYYFSTDSTDTRPRDSSVHLYHQSQTGYITESKTYYVVYKKFSVRFYRNGAQKVESSTANYVTRSCAYAPRSNTSEQKCSIKSPSITNSGYTIIGWGTSSTATTSSWTKGTAKDVTSDGNYYAIYSKSLTFIFDSNGSGETITDKLNSSNSSSSSINISCTSYNGQGCAITTPTISGAPYYFSKSSTDTSQYTQSSHWYHGSLTGKQTVGSTWYVVYGTITINFNKNGVSAIGATKKSCIYAPGNKSCSIKSPSITASSGYSVVGWNTSSGASSSSWNAETSKTVTDNATYYAIQKRNVTYKVYLTKGSKGSWTNGWTDSTHTVTYSDTFSISGIVSSSCVFKGWHVEETGSMYYSFVDAGDNGRHLTAKWDCSGVGYSGACYCTTHKNCETNISGLRTKCEDKQCYWTKQTGDFAHWDTCF